MNQLFKPVRISVYLVILLLVTMVLSRSLTWVELTLLYPHPHHESMEWYRLLSYPLCILSLFSWFFFSVAILLSGYVIEKRVPSVSYLLLIILSAVAGGLTYQLMYQDPFENVPLAGPGMLCWGNIGAAVIIGMKTGQQTNNRPSKTS